MDEKFVSKQNLIDYTEEVKQYVNSHAGGGAVQVPNRYALPAIGNAAIVYFVVDENATYRWDSTDLKYFCVGRDYTEINAINGGSAAVDK